MFHCTRCDSSASLHENWRVATDEERRAFPAVAKYQPRVAIGMCDSDTCGAVGLLMEPKGDR